LVASLLTLVVHTSRLGPRSLFAVFLQNIPLALAHTTGTNTTSTDVHLSAPPEYTALQLVIVCLVFFAIARMVRCPRLWIVVGFLSNIRMVSAAPANLFERLETSVAFSEYKRMREQATTPLTSTWKKVEDLFTLSVFVLGVLGLLALLCLELYNFLLDLLAYCTKVTNPPEQAVQGYAHTNTNHGIGEDEKGELQRMDNGTQIMELDSGPSSVRRRGIWSVSCQQPPTPLPTENCGLQIIHDSAR
jgi:hypothetical protein